MYPKTFEEACTAQGYDAEKVLPDVSMFPQQHQLAFINYGKLVIISEAINAVDKFIPDWNDGDQYKYFPWFDMEVDKNNPSGFRFGDTCCDFTSTFTSGGSRLCFKTSKVAEYAATQFLDLWRDMMTIPKAK